VISTIELEKAGILGKQASKHADIGVKGHICAYTRNAPNSEYLGQQDGMRLIMNMRL
jgi:hypothetical protein